ncbi:MAG: hypothetical protein EPN86_04670 [Nanoarchaeota archaeon]|nr:MAG: hypothetical protein EPN86_04670 [Nanoarchaeota archaeon]
MLGKTIIIYDLNGKSQKEKVRITKKLYGYRDKSNYEYNYDRKGLLNRINLKKARKMVLELESKKDLPELISIFKELGVEAEIARI